MSSNREKNEIEKIEAGPGSFLTKVKGLPQVRRRMRNARRARQKIIFCILKLVFSKGCSKEKVFHF